MVRNKKIWSKDLKRCEMFKEFLYKPVVLLLQKSIETCIVYALHPFYDIRAKLRRIRKDGMGIVHASQQTISEMFCVDIGWRGVFQLVQFCCAESVIVKIAKNYGPAVAYKADRDPRNAYHSSCSSH